MRRVRLSVCAEVYADVVDTLGQADDDNIEVVLWDAVTQLSPDLFRQIVKTNKISPKFKI
jgi:hypothetical protein